MLALTACAVLAGATSVLAVSEWIADAPPHIFQRLGVRLDPLFPKRFLPAESTVRRLLAASTATRWTGRSVLAQLDVGEKTNEITTS
ncbi:transposase family protein [Streptomyces sp. NPDC059850]|uniref:transposase family protein n=1 Tax=Streptomyces sp. NPDC059850 TaxID=3346970 RepID=UPI0036633858